ncbi:hypothetical protein TrVGV298_005794 [Trichoderma virens]|nr:hypothetical protein TrVGV298_005794 [Trichoderma virens]UKZ77850.1 hypothetical protein TrVFT333_005576 [Trichoderma virens FT-333]
MATPANKERPLPSPTQQASSQSAQQQQQRPNSRRFSFLSDKSRKNSIANKIDLHETHAEKDSRRLHSKADPTLAMNEAEPSVEAVMTASSLSSLRAMQHKDSYGNVIADPDLSNPTRSRWERPLDTIRSFEAAIEGDYARRSMHRSETDPSANYSRRNSYYRANQPRFPQDSYYGSRAASFRGEESQYGGPPPASTRNSYYDNQHYSNNNGGYYTTSAGPSNYGRRPSREQTSRMASEPHLRTYGREQNVYPLPHKDRSYETVTSAAASGNSDPAGYQTDPTSSDNSSIHRTSPAKHVNDYGIAFSQSQSYKAPALTVNLSPPGNGKLPTPPTASYQNPLPAIPRKEAAMLKRQVSTTPSGGEKRKSWFSRRFSKNS